jgi:hypothetical protein
MDTKDVGVETKSYFKAKKPEKYEAIIAFYWLTYSQFCSVASLLVCIGYTVWLLRIVELPYRLINFALSCNTVFVMALFCHLICASFAPNTKSNLGKRVVWASKLANLGLGAGFLTADLLLSRFLPPLVEPLTQAMRGPHQS